VGRELLTLKGHTGMVFSVAWSPDGARLATASPDGTAKIWDAAVGRELLTLKGFGGLIFSVAWSPDGARLATGTGSYDGAARVWDAAVGRELLTLKGHTGLVESVSWSPDGARLATASSDGTAKVWDAAGGRELLTLHGQTGVVCWSVSWSPDGRRLATRGSDGVRVLEAADAEAVQEWARQERAVQDLAEGDDVSSSRAQGFLRDWLLLLPLPWVAGETVVQALDRRQIPEEAHARPRAGDRVSLGGLELVWREHRSPGAVVDFNAAAGQLTERSVAYAVCYIESDRERHGLWLQVGCDDRAKVYLNRQEIYRSRSTPSARPPLDAVGPVRLERGINVLVLKVVNETVGWQGIARLVDDAGRQAEGLHVRLAP
jgi:hypothetical protein